MPPPFVVCSPFVVVVSSPRFLMVIFAPPPLLLVAPPPSFDQRRCPCPGWQCTHRAPPTGAGAARGAATGANRSATAGAATTGRAKWHVLPPCRRNCPAPCANHGANAPTHHNTPTALSNQKSKIFLNTQKTRKYRCFDHLLRFHLAVVFQINKTISKKK